MEMDLNYPLSSDWAGRPRDEMLGDLAEMLEDRLMYLKGQRDVVYR